MSVIIKILLCIFIISIIAIYYREIMNIIIMSFNYIYKLMGGKIHVQELFTTKHSLNINGNYEETYGSTGNTYDNTYPKWFNEKVFNSINPSQTKYDYIDFNNNMQILKKCSDKMSIKTTTSDSNDNIFQHYLSPQI